MSNTIKVSVLGDVRDINRKLGDVNNQLSGFGKSASKVGTLAKAAFGALAVGQAVQGIKSVVSAASDAQQSLGATETIFGKFSKTVIDDSKAAALQFGLSANEYRTNANLIGSLFANQGVATDQLAGKTKEMISQASDLAATFGGTTSEAVQALGSAFKGEFDPLERYGISIKQSTINAELAKRGLDGLTGAAAKQAQQMVTTDLIMKQSAKTKGAFAKESDTLANQQQKLTAQFENFKATLGTALLPILTKVFTFLNNNFVPAVSAIGEFLAPVVARVREFFNGAGQGPSKLAPIVDFIKTQLIPAFLNIVTALRAWYETLIPIIAQVVNAIRERWSAIAPIVKDAFESAKQIVVGVMNVIAQVIKLVTSVVQKVWKRWGATILSFVTNTFNNIANFIGGVMKVIAGVVNLVLSILKGDWKGAWNAIKQIVSGVWQAIKAVVSQALNIVKSVMRAAWEAIKAATSAAWNAFVNIIKNQINAAVAVVRGIISTIKGVFSGAGSILLDAGKAIIQGLIDGIESVVGKVKDKLNTVTNLIPDWKGPKEKDKRLLRPTGRWIMESLVKGFDDGRKGIRDSLGDITDFIEKELGKRFKNQAVLNRKTKAAIKVVDKETAALAKNAKKREAVYRKLDKASDKLQELRKASSEYAANVRNSTLDYFNVTNLSTAFNSDALLAGLQKRLDKVRQFTALIADLVSKGLNKNIVDQLVSAGVEGGLATAQAIATGGQPAIDEFNALQTEIDAAANTLGNTAAGSMYDAGIQAAQGLVKGLRSQKQKLEKFARDLAKDLALAVQKALGIRSPSRVFKYLGQQVVAGLEIGIRDNAGVKRGMVQLADAMQRNFDPSLSGNAALAGAGMGGNTYNITVNAPVNVDKAAMGRDIVSAIDAYEQKGGRRRAK